MSIKDSIIKHVNITNIAEEYGLKISFASSNTFDYKCRCPHPDHKNGAERTMSLYMDSNGNSFYCFGCGWGTNVIDFYMVLNNLTFSEAIKEMSSKYDVPIEKGSRAFIVKKPNNEFVKLEIAKIFRMYFRKHYNKKKEIYNIMKKTFGFFDSIDKHDIKKAKALKNKIKSVLKNKVGDV